SPRTVAERLPAWEPPPSQVIGDQLLYAVGAGGGFRDIVVLNVSETSQHILTNEPNSDATMPVWSADGTLIAFASNRDGNYDLFITSADGKTRVNLTDHPGRDMAPVWSPDGTRIAFESFRDGNWDIFVVNLDGSGLVNLTANPARDGNPAWSPDGERLAFVSDRGGDFDLYVVDVGRLQAPQQLTADVYLDAYPAWSPSGEAIAFRSNRRGNKDIYILDLATGQTRLFTFHQADDDQPSWSPDGTRIAFISNRSVADVSGDSYDLYIKNLEGGGLVQLTATTDDEQFPHWRPR
ncbi:MAG: hypothetical protein EOM24_24155, partial [Chloroflexia bacterium]|nr:hypothetical protein [Chloroflexia bacterium]